MIFLDFSPNHANFHVLFSGLFFLRFLFFPSSSSSIALISSGHVWIRFLKTLLRCSRNHMKESLLCGHSGLSNATLIEVCAFWGAPKSSKRWKFIGKWANYDLSHELNNHAMRTILLTDPSPASISSNVDSAHPYGHMTLSCLLSTDL